MVEGFLLWLGLLVIFQIEIFTMIGGCCVTISRQHVCSSRISLYKHELKEYVILPCVKEGDQERDVMCQGAILPIRYVEGNIGNIS